MIPKYHGAKLTDIPDDQLEEMMVWAEFSHCFFFFLRFCKGEKNQMGADVSNVYSL